MKLKELVNVLAPNENVDFVIRGETHPNGMYAREVLESYPHAENYEVIEVASEIAHLEDNLEPTLFVEVTNGKG